MFIVQIAGRLGKDPESRFTPSGQKVTTFNVATDHRKGKEDVTVWVRVTVWGDRLDKIISYLKKGSAVIITGRMNPPSSYVNKEGASQFSLEVTAEMIDFSPFGKDDRSDNKAPNANANTQNSDYSGQANEEGPFQGTPSYANQYNSQTMSGQGNFANGAKDDDLPF
ncbi:MAG: single-stranded DNA-binding protein [Parachlamydiaceae bacterium]|nr:single-stranded DNA-binding protein [Parachlamydiaceae bacterium]